MGRHLKHILPWVTTGREPANQLLLRHSLSAIALQVARVGLFFGTSAETALPKNSYTAE